MTSKLAIRSLLALLFAFALARTATADAPSLDWLVLSETALADWTQAADEGESGRRQYVSQWAKDSAPRYRLLALMPKPSRSYGVALSKIMEVLAEKELGTVIDVINFGNDAALGQQALRWAEANEVQLIFSIGSDATAFVHDNYSGGKLPVVSAVSKDPVLMGQIDGYVRGSGTNIAFTSLNMPMDTQIAYLRQVRPNLKNIGVLYDKRNQSAVVTQVEPLDEAAKSDDFQVLHVAVDGAKAAVGDLKQAMPAAIEEMRKTDPTLDGSVFWITGSTAVFQNIATVNQYAGNVPVISVLPNVVREGEDSAVLAIGVDERTNTHLATIYALEILEGRARPGRLPVGRVTPPDIAINFRVARRIGLQLPFAFFESATFVYDYDGKLVRSFGQNIGAGW
ncbi:MAG: ABC transporter substrate binding protein [Alphaproteobacteria bacterium]